MNSKMMFVAVSRPVVTRRKPEAPVEADADQVVLQMVNAATRKRVNEQKKQELIHRIEDLQRREAAVLRLRGLRVCAAGSRFCRRLWILSGRWKNGVLYRHPRGCGRGWCRLLTELHEVRRNLRAHHLQ